jgi:hypothetical protein
VYKSTAVASSMGVPSKSKLRLFKFFNFEIDFRIGCKLEEVIAHLRINLQNILLCE